MEFRINDIFQIDQKIGAGSFSEVFIGTNTLTKEEIAIKLEKKTTKSPQILYESKIYRILQDGVGIPRLHWFGTEKDMNALVLELLGPNLEDLFNYCGRKFSLKTVLMLAEQMISRIEYLHSKWILHRDVKPGNFLIGRGKTQMNLHVIDFGISKRYMDPITGAHMAYRDGRSMVGSARYVSVNCLQGIETSRRDDLEAIGYCLVYFLKGELPWQGIAASNKKEKYQKILEKKATIAIEVLCEGIPGELGEYIKYCRNLKFDEKPDYEYLRKLFTNLYFKHYSKWDLIYDWNPQEQNSEIKTLDAPKSNQEFIETTAEIRGNGLKKSNP